MYNGGVPFVNPSTQSLGGKASAKKLTAEQRQEKARKAVTVRWAKAKQLKKAA